MSSSSWVTQWAELRSQWQVSTRLRVGAWLIIAILWIYALLVASEAVVSLRKDSASVASEIERLKPLTRANPWPARVDDARQQLAALRTMAWAEGEGGDLGLTEAALQDWVRATAAKSGLRLRDMTLSRAAGLAVDGTGASSSNAAVPGVQRGQAVKLRMTADWGRSELVVFLAELGRSERVVVVERLLLRPAAAPPSAEIDLRVWAHVGASAAVAGPAATGPSR